MTQQRHMLIHALSVIIVLVLAVVLVLRLYQKTDLAKETTSKSAPTSGSTTNSTSPGKPNNLNSLKPGILSGQVVTPSEGDTRKGVAAVNIHVRELAFGNEPGPRTVPQTVTDSKGHFATTQLQNKRNYDILFTVAEGRRYAPERLPTIGLSDKKSYELPPVVLFDALGVTGFSSLKHARNKLALACDFYAGLTDAGREDFREKNQIWLDDIERTMREKIKVLVPAYFYPDPDKPVEWQRILDAAEKYKYRIEFIVILNPNNGPPATGQLDANYSSIAKQCLRLTALGQRGPRPGAGDGSKIQLIGYLPVADRAPGNETSWKLRTEEQLKEQLALWDKVNDKIPLNGLFLDNLPQADVQTVDTLELALRPIQLALQRNGNGKPLFVGNPGVSDKMEGWFASKRQMITNLCLFESDKEFGRFKIPEWVTDHRPASLCLKVSVLAYNVDKATAIRHTRALLVQGCNTFYVTDARSNEPISGLQWGRLPTDWEDWLDAISTYRD